MTQVKALAVLALVVGSVIGCSTTSADSTNDASQIMPLGNSFPHAGIYDMTTLGEDTLPVTDTMEAGQQMGTDSGERDRTRGRHGESPAEGFSFSLSRRSLAGKVAALDRGGTSPRCSPPWRPRRAPRSGIGTLAPAGAGAPRVRHSSARRIPKPPAPELIGGLFLFPRREGRGRHNTPRRTA